MPRARSPDSLEAEKLYRGGMRLIDIAKKLGVPSGTVRRWKSTQGWDGKGKKKQSERSQTATTKASDRKQRGTPKGNKNAVGHGAPKGNRNAYKHGGFTGIYWDKLDEKELEMIEDMPRDEESLLIQEIMGFSVRERRLMGAINQYLDAKAGQYIEGVSVIEEKRSFKNEEEARAYDRAMEAKVKKGKRLPGQKKSVQTNTGAAIDVVIRLEKELTAVQSKKTKAIKELSSIRTERAKAEMEGTGNTVTDNWILGLMGVKEDGTDE